MSNSTAVGSTAGSFIHDWPHSRVRFGAGEHAAVGVEAEILGISRMMMILDGATRTIGDTIVSATGQLVVERTDDVMMHVSSEAVERAVARTRACAADGIGCVGGGSATGLAKGVARMTGLPILAVPTTYAGSEMTAIWGLTDAGRKITGRDERVRPRTVIYDPVLTHTLPVNLTVTSAINAVAHCVEALYARGVSPITVLVASHAIAELLSALPALIRAPTDAAARSQALYGAWLAGWVLNVAAMGLHHKLCHILGGAFDLPHSPLHTVVLPHAVAVNADSAPVAVNALNTALRRCGHDVPVDHTALGLWSLVNELNGPMSLADIGLSKESLPQAISTTLRQIGTARPLHPRDPTDAELRELMTRAFHGTPPASPVVPGGDR